MYAPLDVQQVAAVAAERVLYVFGCVAPGCGRLHGSWRAFRCQLPPAAPSTGVAAKLAALPPGSRLPGPDALLCGGGTDWDKEEPLPSAEAALDGCTGSPQSQEAAGSASEGAWGSSGDWGAPGCLPDATAPAAQPAGVCNDSPRPAAAAHGAPADGWGSGEGWEAGTPGGPSDAFNLSDIDAALAALAHKAMAAPPRTGHARQNPREQARAGAYARPARSNPACPSRPSAQGPAAGPGCVGPASQPRLPGFHLHAAAEPEPQKRAVLPPREAEHIAALLAEYERSNASATVRCCLALFVSTQRPVKLLL